MSTPQEAFPQSESAPPKLQNNAAPKAAPKADQDVMSTGELVALILEGDPKVVADFVRSEKFQLSKKKRGTHEEIMLAIRTAIINQDLAMLDVLDQNFNLDNPNDKKTIIMAVQGGSHVFDFFKNKEKALKQRFQDHEHPLTIAFGAGDYEVAKWLKEWSDQNNVHPAIKNAAWMEAAKRGHHEICDLYDNVSDKNFALMVDALIHHGHSNKVRHFVRRKNAAGRFTNDFSHDNFSVLRSCCGHYDAMSHLIRHPSVQNVIHRLPHYYRTINEVVKRKWERELEAQRLAYKLALKEHALSLVGKGVCNSTAVNIAHHEMEQAYREKLASLGLDSYVYV